MMMGRALAMTVVSLALLAACDSGDGSDATPTATVAAGSTPTVPSAATATQPASTPTSPPVPTPSTATPTTISSTPLPTATATATRAFPAPPALGVQIDRMGRAAINTAVVDPFNGSDALHGQILEDYNASDDPDDWRNFRDRLADNLAILDGLDATCGNQLLAAMMPAADRYNLLAGLLSDDQVYVNTGYGVCSQYLAVETHAVGILNQDCGGRTPLYDVIDVSYSLLATDIRLDDVDDGVMADGDGPPSLTVFPFLRDPT